MSFCISGHNSILSVIEMAYRVYPTQERMDDMSPVRPTGGESLQEMIDRYNRDLLKMSTMGSHGKEERPAASAQKQERSEPQDKASAREEMRQTEGAEYAHRPRPEPDEPLYDKGSSLPRPEPEEPLYGTGGSPRPEPDEPLYGVPKKGAAERGAEADSGRRPEESKIISSMERAAWNERADQGHRDTQQGHRDTQQGRLDAQQGRLDAQQGRLDAQQGNRDTQQGRLDAQQGHRDAQQGRLDTQQGRLDAQQGHRDTQQGWLDAQQGNRDTQQGWLDTQQGWLDTRQGQRDIGRAAHHSPMSDPDFGQAIRELEQGRRELEQGLRDLEEGLSEWRRGLAQWQAGMEEYRRGRVHGSQRGTAMPANAQPWPEDDFVSMPAGNMPVGQDMSLRQTMTQYGNNSQTESTLRSVPGEMRGRAPMPAPVPIADGQQGSGSLLVQVYTAERAEPVAGAQVTVTLPEGSGENVYRVLTTDADGRTPIIPLPVRGGSSGAPAYISPSVNYRVYVTADGFAPSGALNAQLFEGIMGILPVELIPGEEAVR